MTLRVRSAWVASLVALGLVPGLGLLDVAATGPASAASKPAAANPVKTTAGGVKNVTFYYGGGTQLRKGANLSGLGHPSVVVTTAKGPQRDAAAVRAIHSVKAKAYRYVQFYWAPGDGDYEGINLHQHPGWAFCESGQRKVVGRKTAGGKRSWYFLDTNETAVRTRIRSLLNHYKAQGWDGVMFDRGQAATEYGKDIDGRPVWYRRSTCTSHPYKAPARFADAYVNMLGLAHAAGLQAMMNNGKSPFDPVIPMRPAPWNVSCQQARWSKCRFLSDIWSKVNLVLNETATRPRDEDWGRTFTANQRSERDASHAHRTVALITTGSLRGRHNQTRAKVFYAWSRIKLFNLAVSVNTGDGGCPGEPADAVCNRYGVYPQLVDTVWGKPLGPKPVTQSCARGSKVRCVWVRRYIRGTNVINVRGTARKHLPISLGRSTCRYVYDVYHRAPLAGNKCVKTVRMNLPPWSGRPLKTSRTRW
jgi:hypothetical protein